jgi:hypothetical protein
MAFLTLFRVATGDNWNGIMKVSLTRVVLSKQKFTPKKIITTRKNSPYVCSVNI